MTNFGFHKKNASFCYSPRAMHFAAGLIALESQSCDYPQISLFEFFHKINNNKAFEETTKEKQFSEYLVSHRLFFSHLPVY